MLTLKSWCLNFLHTFRRLILCEVAKNLADIRTHIFLAHLWCAYAIPLALSVVRRPSSVVCVVSSNLNAADMKEII